ncbi:MAG: GTPase Era [Treponema sp.]|nr:GTPase Era [Treponema sp.]
MQNDNEPADAGEQPIGLQKKAGFVAMVGRPSAGKSTLVNRLCGEKVSIVSSVPQTTRDAIRGIVNRKQGQLVFVDTPGRYRSEKKGNKRLRDISSQAVESSDLILYVIDATRPAGFEEAEIAALLAPHAEKLFVAINKTDDPRAAIPETRAFLAESLPSLGTNRFFEVSAKNGDGTEALLSAIFGLAEPGDPLYDGELYTDQEVDFRIAEVIREQAINRLQEEIPHSLHVEVADTQLSSGGEEKSAARQKLWVRAFIVVERESQKGIVIGAGGTMIKAIRLAALQELRKIFDWKIDLDLRVKVC